MPRFDRLLTRMGDWMLRVELLFGPETIIALCSLWASDKLLSPPSNFAGHLAAYSMARSIISDEQSWGVGAGVGAIVHIVGLALLSLRAAPLVSIICRCFGLIVSGFCWSVMGWSFLLGDLDSLPAMPFILIGVVALWTLLRFPLVPGKGSK